jgi:hypothetical protein
VEESSEWTSIVNIVKEYRVNFCNGLDGKTLFSALYSMYTVTLKSGTVNKTSVESMAQNSDFQEIKGRKRHVSLLIPCRQPRS